ncbi:uncharacterized protein BJ171DRAFT_132425 [Polychytrium aggregatum]|uniref:uncharacterized protein n=1 Tax=Polychytrium aggregatum TaxID=110093 RepID=UPI0022FF409F|nr:uncharacterized protein BJ171DRAFT_132425 [Polychytrium aggregatum]KAI9203745.1 hypothetical protein BJ171DRAFT_132425 [Polychytrium aggregatum]
MSTFTPVFGAGSSSQSPPQRGPPAPVPASLPPKKPPRASRSSLALLETHNASDPVPLAGPPVSVPPPKPMRSLSTKPELPPRPAVKPKPRLLPQSSGDQHRPYSTSAINDISWFRSASPNRLSRGRDSGDHSSVRSRSPSALGRASQQDNPVSIRELSTTSDILAARHLLRHYFPGNLLSPEEFLDLVANSQQHQGILFYGCFLSISTPALPPTPALSPFASPPRSPRRSFSVGSDILASATSPPAAAAAHLSQLPLSAIDFCAGVVLLSKQYTPIEHFYVEHLRIDDRARGYGIRTKLLAHVEILASEKGLPLVRKGKENDKSTPASGDLPESSRRLSRSSGTDWEHRRVTPSFADEEAEAVMSHILRLKLEDEQLRKASQDWDEASRRASSFM